MSSKHVLLDVPVKNVTDLDEGKVSYIFQKDEHANILLENLAEMQANEGLMTDQILCTATKDHEEPFHSMLLAACSRVLKQRLTGEHFDRTGGKIVLKGMTKELFESFREFLYRSKLVLDKENVEPLQEFAKKYGIDSLAEMCATFQAQHEDRKEMEVPFDEHKNILHQLYDMFLKEELTTTVLEDSEGKSQYAVHGALLVAASPVLQEIIADDMFDQEEAVKYRLKIITSSILGDLIEYIYSAEVTLGGENVQGLLQSACRYEIPALARACCDWLCSELHTDNAVGMLWFARKLDREYTRELEEASKSFIVVNFQGVSEGEEFAELKFEDLVEIITDDKLDVESENTVFRAVIKWVKASEDDRLSYLSDLLQCVRLEFTSFEFLEEVERDPLIQKSSQCHDVIRGARQKLAERKASAANEVIENFSGQEDFPEWPPSYSDGYEDFAERTPSQYDHGEDVQKMLPPELSDDEFEYKMPPRINDDEMAKQVRGRKKNGDPDMRFKINRSGLGFATKGGNPDMRFKINKEAFGSPKPSTPQNKKQGKSAVVKVQNGSPLRKDGKLDMRFKVNKEAVRRSSPGATLENHVSTQSSPIQRHLKKDGTPDKRFTVNKTPPQASSRSSMSQLYSGDASGPVKKDGTPDMRYAANKQACSHVSSGDRQRTVPQLSSHDGPLKRDGTPDMRYSVNKPSYSCGGSTSSPSSSSTSNLSTSSSGSYGGAYGPVKRDGTPDMRYAVNKPSYSSSGSSSRYSSASSLSTSSSGSYGGGSRSYGGGACGPLKANGTPDMRFKSNR